jgi:hypothetical protein
MNNPAWYQATQTDDCDLVARPNLGLSQRCENRHAGAQQWSSCCQIQATRNGKHKLLIGSVVLGVPTLKTIHNNIKVQLGELCN